MVDGTTYQVIAKAQDKAGNWAVEYSTVTFFYDVTAPTITITRPTSGGYYGTSNLLTIISGTVADQGASLPE